MGISKALQSMKRLIKTIGENKDTIGVLRNKNMMLAERVLKLEQKPTDPRLTERVRELEQLNRVLEGRLDQRTSATNRAFTTEEKNRQQGHRTTNERIDSLERKLTGYIEKLTSDSQQQSVAVTEIAMAVTWLQRKMDPNSKEAVRALFDRAVKAEHWASASGYAKELDHLKEIENEV